MPSPKRGRILKDKLQQGDTVYGTLIQHAVTPSMVDLFPEGALEFVIVTAEHNALDIADFLPLRYSLASKGIACLAHTHSRSSPDDVAKVCDSFDGVVIPYVEEVEPCKRLAAAAIYRPLKGETLERVITEGKWPSEATRKYVTEEKCADTLFIPMIESAKGVENLDAICSIPGVDALFVGPNDLTTNMGIPNEYGHPDLIAMLQRIIDAGDRRHIAAGCRFGKVDQAIRTIRQDARLVVFSNDGSLLQSAITSTFSQLKQA